MTDYPTEIKKAMISLKPYVTGTSHSKEVWEDTQKALHALILRAVEEEYEKYLALSDKFTAGKLKKVRARLKALEEK